jgi:hypothetical protein
VIYQQKPAASIGAVSLLQRNPLSPLEPVLLTKPVKISTAALGEGWFPKMAGNLRKQCTPTWLGGNTSLINEPADLSHHFVVGIPVEVEINVTLVGQFCF